MVSAGRWGADWFSGCPAVDRPGPDCRDQRHFCRPVAAVRGGKWLALGLFLGLLLSPWLLRTLHPGQPVFPDADIAAPGQWLLLLVAGVLVGYGTRMANGCTSGHGVCGLARLSPRSLVAVLVFMGSAMLTVALLRHLPGGVS